MSLMTAANTQHIMDLEAQHLVHSYNRAPFVLTHGEGVHLYDTDGKAYLDMVAGIAVNALGHNDPELVEAISQQAASPLTSNPSSLALCRLFNRSFLGS